MGVDSAIRTLEDLLGAARTVRGAAKGNAFSDWLTATETVGYLGFPSRKALYQAIRRGQVPVHRLGRRLRFHRPELDRVLAHGQ